MKRQMLRFGGFYTISCQTSDIDATFMKGRTVVVGGKEELDLINKTIDGISVIGKNN